MRKVELYGDLGQKFGKSFELNVKTVRQAVKLLSANFKTFKQHLIDSEGVVGYEVWDGDYNLGGDSDEFIKHGDGTIKIIPVVEGAGATGRIIAGVVIIVVGAIIDIYSQGGFTSATGGYGYTFGVALIAGGLAEKLAPKPRDVNTSEVENTRSYVFSGAVNTTRQGVAIPLGYGKMLIGSSVISASLTTTDIPI